MEVTLKVKPQGSVSRFCDALVKPAMYCFSGTIYEAPQQTHFWNNTKLTGRETAHLLHDYLVHAKGIPGSMPRIKPIFHFPIFGGWRDYIVLTPTGHKGTWHVGWIDDDSGVSQIVLQSPVRMLIGPGPSTFFGLAAENNIQIKIEKIGTGRIGEGGEYACIPLL